MPRNCEDADPANELGELVRRPEAVVPPFALGGGGIRRARLRMRECCQKGGDGEGEGVAGNGSWRTHQWRPEVPRRPCLSRAQRARKGPLC